MNLWKYGCSCCSRSPGSKGLELEGWGGKGDIARDPVDIADIEDECEERGVSPELEGREVGDWLSAAWS